jgi:cellulose synthase/poly-beta-1,6-N-acetylglucosamine synthase-like glycosyltransferase
MEEIQQVMDFVLAIFSVLTIYSVVLVIIGFLVPAKKFKKTDNKYNYAIIIAARNEEKAIGQLLSSLKSQNYPANKFTTFVVAHNCTDNTAELARNAGVIVFEYNNDKERRKGYALRHAFNRIISECEQGIYSFDGYFIVDADTVLEKDYIVKMNDAFDNKKYDMYSSYINSKNTDRGVFSSFRSITYFSSSCTSYRPRSILGLSPILPGTGILIRNNILRNGWEWTTLVEDQQMSAANVAKGYRITTVQETQFFVENPPNLKALIKQQMRWQRGVIFSFFKTFLPLLFGIIAPYDFGKNKKNLSQPKSNTYEKGWHEIIKRLSCYDSLLYTFPVFILNFFMGVVYPLIVLIITIATQSPNVLSALSGVFTYYLLSYCSSLLTYIATTIREHKHIRASKMYFLYIFIWPIINIFMQYVSFLAIFIPVKWKPIPRTDERTIEEINEIKPIAELVFTRKTEQKKTNAPVSNITEPETVEKTMI